MKVSDNELSDFPKNLLGKEEVKRVREQVEEVLNEIRPSLQDHRGDVELVDVSEDGVVSLRLKGACAGCPMSQMTVKMGIERVLKSRIPEIKEVVAVEPEEPEEL